MIRNETNSRALLCVYQDWARYKYKFKKDKHLKIRNVDLLKILIEEIDTDMFHIAYYDAYHLYYSIYNTGAIKLGVNELNNSQVIDILCYIIESEFKLYVHQCNMYIHEYNLFMKAKECLKEYMIDKYVSCKWEECLKEQASRNQIIIGMLRNDIVNVKHSAANIKPTPYVYTQLDLDFMTTLYNIQLNDSLELINNQFIELGINELNDSQVIDILIYAIKIVTHSVIIRNTVNGHCCNYNDICAASEELLKWTLDRYNCII